MIEEQIKFAQMVGWLISWAYANSYQLTLGEAYRTPEQAERDAQEGKGIKNSLHTKRLAIDLNLFTNEEYQSDSKAYETLGKFWKTLDPLARWGGDFKNPDGNHFSLEYNGVE